MASQLKQQLEPLTHRDRMRRMVELGTRAKTDAQVTEILDDLEKGDFSDRVLALQSCYGSKDGVRVLRALADPSLGVRSIAMQLVALVADDTQVQVALSTVTFKQRRNLLQKLLKRRRRSCIDTFVIHLGDLDSKQFGRLLAYGSAEIVNRHIETVIDRYGINDWQLLGRLHPQIAGNILQKQANTASDFDPRLASQINAVLPTLSEFFPETALLICRAASGTVPLSQLSLQSLALRRPKEITDLILSSDSTPNINFNQVAHKLEIEQLIELLTKHTNTVNGQYILSLLPPSRREILYNNFADSWRDREGCLTPDIVSNLPHYIREQEARYHLNLPALATRPSQRLPYAAFLPYSEARGVLDSFIRNPDPDLRVVALSTLVSATRYNPSYTAETLTIVKQRRNEQDPIRGAMISGLAALPPSIWHREHLDDLSQIISDALNAADLSYSTANALERLVIAILPFHPAWSAKELAILVNQRGEISFYNLGSRLSDADVSRIAPSLLPVLQDWETRDRGTYIISAATSLGHRLKVFDALVDILERIVNDAEHFWIASSALDLIAKYRRDKLNVLIPKLLQQDPSWITQHTVYNFVHRHRQDLITPFLGQKAYSGSFSTGKTRFVLPLINGFHRWTTRQQEIFALTLTEITQDSACDFQTLYTAINQLAALSAVQPTRLLELASHSNSKLAIRDVALRALSRLDAGQGIPTLIEAMGDDRARIAIYALRSSLLQMPVTQALPMLRAVPLEKVTVAKEVVRLLGELPSEEAYQELLTWDRRDLHRDVRVAFLRALWSHLERDTTWSILEAAATSDDAAIATVVGRIPTDRLSSIAQRRLLELLATLLIHPDPLVRLDVLQRCYQLPVNDPEQILLPKLLQAINSPLPDECSTAANAVVTTYSGSKFATVVGDTIRNIIGNRRALQTLVRMLINTLSSRRQQLLPTAHAVIEAMASDPLTATLQVELAIPALPWDELAIFFQKLAVSDQMHPEVLFTAVDGIRETTGRNDANQLEELLVASNDDRLRRIALAALITQSQTHGWNNERKQRLYAFRNDPSVMVASSAQFILLPPDT